MIFFQKVHEPYEPESMWSSSLEKSMHLQKGFHPIMAYFVHLHKRFRIQPSSRECAL